MSHSQPSLDSSALASRRSRSIPESSLRDFFDIVATMDDVISLGLGEPDFATPPRICQAAVEALSEGLTHYTSNAGTRELRDAIAGHIQRLYGVSYDPAGEVVVTIGVSEALYLALMALVDPGDEVIVVEPCFVSYAPEVQLAGGIPVRVAARAENAFQVDAADVEAAITPRTKAILLGYPNNPTGAVMGRERLLALARLAEAHDLVVISDEIYDRLVYGVEHHCFAALPGMRERTLLLQGFSKAYAMTGWRIGYAAGPRALLTELNKVHQYTIMCAAMPTQVGALRALQDGEEDVQRMRQIYDRRRRLIVDGLNAIGLPCIEPHGAFYAFPSIRSTGMSSTEFAESLLKEERVAVIPGHAFGACGEGYVRCSYASSMENIEAALDHMQHFLRRHSI